MTVKFFRGRGNVPATSLPVQEVLVLHPEVPPGNYSRAMRHFREKDIRITVLGRWGERNDLYPGKSEARALEDRIFIYHIFILSRSQQETEFFMIVELIVG